MPAFVAQVLGSYYARSTVVVNVVPELPIDDPDWRAAQIQVRAQSGPHL